MSRPRRHTTPWGAVYTTTYNGLTVDSADLMQAPALDTVTTLDALGRPMTITDPKGGVTKYTLRHADELIPNSPARMPWPSR